MKTQHYMVRKRVDGPMPVAGQFIMRDDEDETVRGFVSNVVRGGVGDVTFEVVMFEPTELPDDIGAIQIAETLKPEQWQKMLVDVLRENPAAAFMWRTAMESVKDATVLSVLIKAAASLRYIKSLCCDSGWDLVATPDDALQLCCSKCHKPAGKGVHVQIDALDALTLAKAHIHKAVVGQDPRKN